MKHLMLILLALACLSGALAAQVNLTERQAELAIYRSDSLRVYVDQWRQDSITVALACSTVSGYRKKAAIDSTALVVADSLVNASHAAQERLQRAIRVRNGVIAGSGVIVVLLSIILILR